ncbi:FAD-dependent oxidoreductase [Spongiibacter marinus]|uniref:FAD-dependent oxidoreductase n=1 Tax=Spongiibacter marinus TaxID=354246 RepID=UPI00195F2A27|nr:FAD-dependent oxidoreductase [Spongiibacter marinus]MBM7422371.1 NADPH-dependent glutamate synthase beta subunit-like oxidoreductase [Spongiibacter marinus]
MKPTDVKDPEYFHRVVDCQYACPAHTPVPEYIRLIAAQRYTDAYMVNWESNVFPGVLGRTCDRPCEPACRRGRVEEEPVAICRLKRLAADNKADIQDRLPIIPKKKNGKRIALVGAGPASLTVARDLMPLGYNIDLFDEQPAGGGFMRSQIPAFRLPESVLNEEVDTILHMGVVSHFRHYVDSLKALLEQGDYDAVFVGSGAPMGRDLDISGREAADANIHIGINWLASVAFGHVQTVGRRVLVLGGGNTAMDCCRTARRLGGEDVRVVVRSPFEEMKASPWEKEDAQQEGIPIYDNHVPKAFLVEDGKLVGMRFEKVKAVYEDGKRQLIPTGEPPVDMACDDVLVAIGQQNAFPWIERDIGIEFDQWQLPVVDKDTFQSTLPNVFFGGDAAFGPENVITAVAHGHQAAISIDLFCRGESVTQRPPPGVTLVSQKMGIHEWSYDNQIEDDARYRVPHANLDQALSDRSLEVELGFDAETAFHEAQRCLNCDAQTVFTEKLCIECDACLDICPTSCLSFVVNDDEESTLRQKLRMPANNPDQAIYVSEDLATGRAMVKDENVCLHCGLCAERCPTAAWDMQQFYYSVSKAGEEVQP